MQQQMHVAFSRAHAFIFKHAKCFFCNASTRLSTSTSDPLPLLHNSLPPAGSPPSLRSVFPASDPGLFLWFRKWLTCHRKQMGVWAWHMASSPHPLSPAASIRRWGLSPHDEVLLPYITHHKYLTNMLQLMLYKMCWSTRASEKM